MSRRAEDGDAAGRVVPLLQRLVRNRCVNDGTPDSGHEVRNADAVCEELDHPAIDLQRFEPHPERTSLVARMGDPDDGPTLLFHVPLDVTPADDDQWTRDPFGGEVVDGEVWGRGTIDLLLHVASAAVAVRDLADAGFRPRGCLTLVAAADQRAGGRFGVRWLQEHHPELLEADWALVDGCGPPLPGPAGPVLCANVGEKGSVLLRLEVRGRGTQPEIAPRQSAISAAAEVVGRLEAHDVETDAPSPLHELLTLAGWEGVQALLDNEGEALDRALAALPGDLPAVFHAGTHHTFSVSALSGRSVPCRTPEVVVLEARLATVPGADEPDPIALVKEALGDLAGQVSVEVVLHDPASTSPTETPLWRALLAAGRRHYPSAALAPLVTSNMSAAGAYRRAGTPAYGFTLTSRQLTWLDLMERQRGFDERIDLETVAQMAQLWPDLAQPLLAPGDADA